MSEFQARDALFDQVLCVDETDQPSQLPGLANADSLCAVFTSAAKPTASNFRGFVTTARALRHPSSQFKALLGTKPTPTVDDSTNLEELVWRLSAENETEALAMFDEDASFVGAITPASLLVAQLRYARDLQDNLRLHRLNVQKDKKRRKKWNDRLERINQSVKKLFVLLTQPAGPDLFQRGIETLSILIDATYGAVVFTGPQGQLKESIFTGATPGSDITAFLAQRKPLLDHVIETGTSLTIENVPRYLTDLKIPTAQRTLTTFLGVPVMRDDKSFGCVYFCNRSNDQPFTPDDEMLASSLANALALVISQAQDRTERKRAEKERELLAQLGLRLTVSTGLDQISHAVAEITSQICPWERFSLAVRRYGLTRFRYVTRVTNQQDTPLPDEPMNLNLSTRPELLTLLQGNALITRTLGTEPLPAVFAPVWVENEVASLLILERRDPELTEKDMEFLKLVADTIGPSIARCQAETRNAAFLSLAYQLTRVHTPEEAARVIVATADELFGWDSCSVSLFYPDHDLGKSVLHVDVIDGVRAEVPYMEELLPPGKVSRLAMTEGPQLILRDDIESDVEGLGTFGDTTRRSLSLMFVPLRLGATNVGVFSIQSYTRNAYTPSDLQFLQALADLCAGAMERTRPEPDKKNLPKTRKPARRSTPSKSQNK